MTATLAAPTASFVIEDIDHFVLTVRDIATTCDFYSRVLGMRVIRFGEGRTALRFGGQKINLHQAGAEHAPHAAGPVPGSGDFCLVTLNKITDVVRHLEACGVPIELGPVQKTGALGPITSVYFRDPDGNLIEVSRYGA